MPEEISEISHSPSTNTPHMKFNWGTGITIFFILFAASMTFAVIATTRYPPQMVQKDYYALDLNYQARLVQKQNTAALTTLPKVQYDGTAKTIRVALPEGMTASTGTAKCYRSMTTKDDFTTKFEQTSEFAIPAATLTAGRWHLELEWEAADGKKYFWDTAITL